MWSSKGTQWVQIQRSNQFLAIAKDRTMLTLGKVNFTIASVALSHRHRVTYGIAVWGRAYFFIK